MLVRLSDQGWRVIHKVTFAPSGYGVDELTVAPDAEHHLIPTATMAHPFCGRQSQPAVALFRVLSSSVTRR